MKKSTSKKTSLLEFKVHPLVLAVLVVIIVLAMGVYIFHVLSNVIYETPQAIFSQAFKTDLNDISELQGDGGWAAGYEYYLHFKSKQMVDLKHASEYEEKYCENARRWFLAKYPQSASLMDNQHLHLLARRKNTEISVINQWLLYNIRTDDYFYRIWGVK